MDADGSTSIRHVDAFMEACHRGSDVIIGSRKIRNAFIEVYQPVARRLMGNMGNWLIRMILGLWSYPDTQCGFKMLSEYAARDIAERLTIDRFGFDFELLVIAENFGFEIKQLPVRWQNKKVSSVNFSGPNGFMQVLLDLLKTRWQLEKGLYDREP